MAELTDTEKKILDAIKPGYDMLVLVVPGYAKINDFAAADGLATLKKKGLIAFEGRGKFKSCYLTDAGKEAFESIPRSPETGEVA